MSLLEITEVAAAAKTEPRRESLRPEPLACFGIRQTMGGASFERIEYAGVTFGQEFIPQALRPVPQAPPPPPPGPEGRLGNCTLCGLQLSPEAASCPHCGHPAKALIKLAPVMEPKQQCGMAITSFVLGSLSLVGAAAGLWGILAAIPAILLGQKAYRRAQNVPDLFAGQGLSIAGFLMGCGSIPLCLTMAQHVHAVKVEVEQDHQWVQAAKSESNLKEIGLAFISWESSHEHQFPFNIGQEQGGTRELSHPDATDGVELNPAPIFRAMSNELAVANLLVCPGDGTKRAAANFESLTADNIGYELRTGPEVTPQNPDGILMIDSIHGLVLHCDGRVEHDYHYQKSPEFGSESNLREIGRAFLLWSVDHNYQFPFNVSQAQGGTREFCFRGSDGMEANPAPTFKALANLLTTKTLISPNDSTRHAALIFEALTANNISYQLRTGPDVNENNPDAILMVDPINGLVLYCDGRVERNVRYKK